MRCVVGQVKEERPVAVGGYHLHGLIREVVREVARRLERLAAVVDDLPGMRSPQEAVDGVEGLLGIHDVRGRGGQEHGGTGHEPQRFVEAMGLRRETRVLAQVPFAEVHGVIATTFQQARQRNLAGRQALLFIRRHVGNALLVEDGICWGTRRAVRANDARETDGNRGELETDTGRVAASEQRRARRRARGIARIAGGELGPFRGDAVDVGGGHEVAGNAAAAQRDVVVAEVVGNNEHDVRCPGGRACR